MTRSSANTARTRIADPVDFAARVLGVKLWPLQAEILSAIVANRRVAVRSCHSSGKTYLAAVAALYWLLRWRNSKVIIVTPSHLQMRTVLFAQIHQFLRAMRFRIPADQNQTEIRLSPSNFVLGVATDQAERLQGHHAGRLLVIADEAPGIDGAIWEAVESLLASGDARVLAIGNPVVAGGYFHSAFTRAANSWRTFAIGWRDTPNFEQITSIDDLLALPDAELDRNPWPTLLTRRWVGDAYARWWNGTIDNSPLWAARVEGEFPSQSENSLIALAEIEHARRPAVDSGGNVAIGVDIGGPGSDETVLAVMQSDALLELQIWNVPDPRGVIVEACQRWRSRLSAVRIDAIGIGYHVATHLSDLELPVEPINVASASSAPERFINLRAELTWGMRERFRAGAVTGIGDDGLASQLAALRYELTSRGQVQIENKADMRKRIGRSPDRADALMLALGARAGADLTPYRRMNDTWHSTATTPENRERSYQQQYAELWSGAQPRSRRWEKVCADCGRPIRDGEPWTNRVIGPYSGTSYAHAQCGSA